MGGECDSVRNADDVGCAVVSYFPVVWQTTATIPRSCRGPASRVLHIRSRPSHSPGLAPRSPPPHSSSTRAVDVVFTTACVDNVPRSPFLVPSDTHSDAHACSCSQFLL